MKVIVGILLILLIVIMVVLLSIVAYLLWDEVCEVREKHRRTRIATQRLEENIERMNREPQTDCDGCKHYADEYTADACYECKRSYKDCYELQTDCSWK